jgi:hypothetical protein
VKAELVLEFYVHVEIQPNGRTGNSKKAKTKSPHEYFALPAMSTWLDPTTSRSVYVKFFEHPETAEKLTFEQLLDRPDADSVLRKYIFPDSRQKGTWGEVLLNDLQATSLGPCGCSKLIGVLSF